jgi:hypothetical protein
MPSLRKTNYTGTVTWLGVVKDSEKDLRAEKATCLSLTLAGHEGECHSGLTRPSCSRYDHNDMTLMSNISRECIKTATDFNIIMC